VDRGRKASKRHLIVDGRGVPLAVAVTAANVNDYGQLLPLVDAAGGGVHGEGRLVLADRGYDSRAVRDGIRARGYEPRIPTRNLPPTNATSARRVCDESMSLSRAEVSGATHRTRGGWPPPPTPARTTFGNRLGYAQPLLRERIVTDTRMRSDSPVRRTHPARPPAKPARPHLVLTAARGPVWLLVRMG
jgi:transposase